MIKNSQKLQAEKIFIFTILAILLLAFFLRVHHLTADAPLGISPTPELSLDGPATIADGRSMALFGEWDAYPGLRNTSIMYPFMNWTAFLFFRMLGVSYWSANLISVFASIFSIVLAAGFARQHFSRRAGLFSAFFLAINYIYIIYNRDPMAYTMVASGMVFILFAWGRGLKQPVWFFISGAGTIFVALFVKLPAISFLPAALLAFLWLIWQKKDWRNIRAYVPLLLYASGLLLMVAVWAFLLYQPQPEAVDSAYYARVLNPLQKLEQSVRVLIMTFLFMGADYGFTWRMLPVFVLTYGYILGRLLQFTKRKRPFLPVPEFLLIVYLLSTLAMLLITLIRPLRYQIVLIPLMCIMAGIALDRLLKQKPIPLPTQFGKLFPLFLYAGLTYLAYQVIMAIHSFVYLKPLQQGFAQRWYAPEVLTLFIVLGISLIATIPLVLFYLVRATRDQPFYLLPKTKGIYAILVGILVLSALLQFFQYTTMQQTIQFSTVETARRIAQDLPADNTILAGAYALPLALENELPAIWLIGADGQKTLDVEFTHLIIDESGPYLARYYTELHLRDIVPELFENAHLVKTYKVREYTVNVYEIEQNISATMEK